MLADLGLPRARRLPRRRLGTARRADGEACSRRSSSVLLDERPDARVRRRRRQLDARRARWPPPSSASRSPTSRPGLRSFDWTMPEEINRVLTDRLSDLLFTHSPEAATNLAAEGIDAEPRPLRRQHDDRLAAALRGTCRASAPRGGRSTCSAARVRARHPAPPVQRRRAAASCGASSRRSRRWPRAAPVVFPVHPRTRAAPAGRRARCRASRPPACAAWTRGLPRLPRPRDRRRRDRDRLRRRAGGGRRRSASRASRCAATPSARSRSRHGTNVLLGEDPAAIARIRPAALERRPVRHRADGTATPASGWPTCSSRALRVRAHGGRRMSARRRPCRGPRLRHRPRRHGRGRSALRRLRDRTRAGAQHMAVNAAKLVAMRRDDGRCGGWSTRCELVTADGQAVVWASRLLGDPLPDARRRHRPDAGAAGARGAARLSRVLPRR